MKFNTYFTENIGFYPYVSNDHNYIQVASRPLAQIEADDLEDAFEKTQHIDESWFGETKAGVKLFIRSTSVGDIFVNVDTKEAWVVESMGFSLYKGETKF